jgi:hypothetical protein
MRARQIQLTHSYATFILHCPLRLGSFCMHLSSKRATCPANHNVLDSITNYEGPTATRLTCSTEHTCLVQPPHIHNAAKINRPTRINAFPIPLFALCNSSTAVPHLGAGTQPQVWGDARTLTAALWVDIDVSKERSSPPSEFLSKHSSYVSQST